MTTGAAQLAGVREHCADPLYSEWGKGTTEHHLSTHLKTSQMLQESSQEREGLVDTKRTHPPMKLEVNCDPVTGNKSNRLIKNQLQTTRNPSATNEQLS